MLLSTRNRSPTSLSTLEVIAGDANTQTLPLAASFGFARSNHSPIHARKSLALSHWLSHSSSFLGSKAGWGGGRRRLPAGWGLPPTDHRGTGATYPPGRKGWAIC